MSDNGEQGVGSQCACQCIIESPAEMDRMVDESIRTGSIVSLE